MPNRLTRDQILQRALNNIDSPSLNQIDRPDGAVLPSALCVGWLQEGLDYFISRFPWGATIVTTTITMLDGVEVYNLPSDFITDYRDGVLHDDDTGRLERKGLGQLLDFRKKDKGKPAFYTIQGQKIRLCPIPGPQQNGKKLNVYYYQQPATIEANSVPVFPSDLILIRYTYLRGCEWTRSCAPGTAEKYASDLIADFQGQGLGVEAEDSSVPFSRQTFPGSRMTSDPNSWMGTAVLP